MDKNINSIQSQGKIFYKISGITTIIMMLFFLFDTIGWVFLGPYPDSGKAWFTLLHERKLVGIILLSFPTYFGMILYTLTFISLYNLLKETNAAFTSLATLTGFIGLTIIIATYSGFTVLANSNQYFETAQEAQRVSLIFSAESGMALFSGGMMKGGFLAEGALLIFSLIMLKNNYFGKLTAYLGIIGHGLDFFRICMNLAFLPENIGSVLLAVGGLPQLLWIILVGIKIYKKGENHAIS